MIDPVAPSISDHPAPRWSLRNPLFAPTGRRLTLGLGLIGIGKPWGHAATDVPDETKVRELLETAFTLGIRYLDTAPSYGMSEPAPLHLSGQSCADATRLTYPRHQVWRALGFEQAAALCRP
jgi:Aldo/keto reductase family